jgi:DNA primase
VLAFTGRTVVDGEPRKYVNTPETPAYSKGKVLFALDLARAGIEERGHAVLMEGQFDVIVGHRFGVTNAIASSGTALTGDQLTLLRRFTDEIVLMFDNDGAGRGAAAKAIELAQVGVWVARIEGDAKDPDEFLRGGGSWDAVLSAKQLGWDWWLEHAIAGLDSQDPANREVGIRRIKAILDKIKDPIQKDTHAEHAARKFAIRPELLLRPITEPPVSGLGTSARGNKGWSRIDYLLGALVVRPEALRRVLGILDPADLGETGRATFLRLVTALERGGSDGLGQDLDGFTPEEQQLIRRAWADPPPRVDDETVDDVVRNIQRQVRMRRRLEVVDLIKEAERQGDLVRAEALEAQLKPRTERT